ncbi:MAG: glycosyltransferase family 39 protein [Anaerolineae bacterium]
MRRSLRLGVLLLAFGLRLYRLGSQSIWWDEGHSIQMASAPISHIPTLPGMDVHPPGYFVLLHQWMALTGLSEFALRYLSVLFSLATVALAMRFGRVLQPGRARLDLALLAGLLTALSPLYVAYAQEVRMYAMVTFWALASVYLQWRLLAGSRGRWLWPGYVVATALSLYTHYFTGFLLLFENLAWLIWVWRAGPGGARRARVTGWFGAQLGVLVLFGPQLSIALRQVTAYTNPNLVPPALGTFLGRSWQAYTVGLTVRPGLAGWGMGVALVVLAVGAGWALAGPRPGGGGASGYPALFFAGWLVLPLGAYYLVLQRQPSFEPRYMMLITPALFLLLAYGLLRLAAAGAGGPALAWLGSLALLAVFGLGLHSYFTDVDFFKDDSAAVAAWLAAETTANDVVLVDVPHPFHYYAARGDIPAPVEYLFVDVHTAAQTLTEKTRGRERLFWVTWPRGDTDPRGVIPFLAGKQGQHLGRVAFRGYNVDGYRLGGQPFSLPDELAPASLVFGDGGAGLFRLDGLAYGGRSAESQQVWTTLHFSLLRETEVDYRVSVRLRGSDGRVVAQVDKDLLNDRHFRTSAWPLDDARLNQAVNVYTLPVAPDAPPGDYTLEVVVYDAATLAPLPVQGASAGAADPGLARVGQLTVVP